MPLEVTEKEPTEPVGEEIMRSHPGRHRRGSQPWHFLLVATLFVAAPMTLPGCPKEIADEGAKDSVCSEHGVPEGRCPFCNPALIKAMGICKGHSVPEALCTLCDDSIIPGFVATGDWCAGHDIPESQCTICNPGILDAGGVEGSESAFAPERGFARVERETEEEKPRAERAPSVRCDTERLRVRLDSPEVVRVAGLEFVRVEERSIRRTVECNAEIHYDEDRLARVGARVPGVIREVHAGLGDRVEAGQPLAVIDSIELGSAKAEHQQALALRSLWKRNSAREKALLDKGISTEQEALEAEQRSEESRIEVEKAVQHLRNLGLADEAIAESAGSGDTSSLYHLPAPREGVVIERQAVVGQVVEPTEVLFVVVDPSRMWATLDVYEDRFTGIRIGQGVVLRPDGLLGEAFAGRITWVGTAVDPRTRTIPVRTELANPDGRLRARMFGRAEIQVGKTDSAVVVPREAVQWEGCCNIVFLRRGETLFEPRKVRLGLTTERAAEVLSGLEPGDVVVTKGAFLLKTEILRESIGAGCCEVEPPSR